MEVKDLENRMQKCSFILKTLLKKWDTLGKPAQGSTTYSMVKEALDMLNGHFHDMEVVNAEIDDKTFMELAVMAHEQDITINQLCEQALRIHISTLEKQEEENSEEK